MSRRPARLLQRAHGFQRNQIAAFHVGGTAAVSLVPVPAKWLLLQHRIEMTDQQQPGRTFFAAVLRDEVSCATDAGR